MAGKNRCNRVESAIATVLAVILTPIVAFWRFLGWLEADEERQFKLGAILGGSTFTAALLWAIVCCI